MRGNFILERGDAFVAIDVSQQDEIWRKNQPKFLSKMLW